MTLQLRPLREEDEAAFREACAAPGLDFIFALGFSEDRDFSEYLAWLERLHDGGDPEQGLVPATYLLAEVDGRIVGRVSLRHELNESLLRDGGHIGYGVLPEYRGRGYATQMLRLALREAARLGIGKVLLTVRSDNLASLRVIERNGGEYDPSLAVDNGMRHYWIPTSSRHF